MRKNIGNFLGFFYVFIQNKDFCVQKWPKWPIFFVSNCFKCYVIVPIYLLCLTLNTNFFMFTVQKPCPCALYHTYF